ncbi:MULTISPECIES: hypothetical protein [unclassified Pseudomonas]|uniref:hypothetical protein n=1 Tax=unclassified Pseudomonas TaxID=196821 RepID=UPI00128D5BB2|nr:MULTISPECIES: hypothetical protein [unclassified Pseudomonas]MPQ68535.1 hypothetical protein [Pseudomonas sp. MWU12-2323]
MIGEILQFLTPSLSNPLEVFFFSIILFGLLLSLITSQVFGQPAKWEKNWRGGARINALDIEHGSIGELSHAVASGWERFASNMPGLLLIVGLLGTFLGLGLALDKASTILQGHDDSLNAMSDSLTQLTGMMKDLGTKFKTSTWGIMAFIVIKLWEAAPWSAESKRTDWCLGHMKAEIDLSRKNALALHAERDQVSLTALETVGTRLIEAFNAQGLLLSTELKQLKAIEFQSGKQSESQLTSLDERLASLAIEIDLGRKAALAMRTESEQANLTALENVGTRLIEAFNAQGLLLSTELKQLKAVEFQNGKQAESYFAAMDTRLTEHHQQLGVIARFSENLPHLAEMSAQLTRLSSIEKSLKGMQTFETRLGEVADNTKATNECLQGYVEAKTDNLQRQEAAVQLISESATLLADSAGLLKGSVQVMQEKLSGAIESLNEDFAGHLAEMKESMDGNITKLGTVMESIEGSLSGTITTMSRDFTQNTQDMAANLKGATDNISTAVHELSEHVGTVVKEVQVTTHDAKEMQKNTSIKFTQTSTTLNEAIVTMSSNMNELGKSISEGLKEASKAGHKMDAVASKLVTFPQLAEQFTVLNVQFKTMTEQSAKTQEALEALPARLAPLSESVKLLEQLCDSTRQLPPVAQDVKAIADLHREGQLAMSVLPQQLAANIDKQFADRLQVLSAAAQSTVTLLDRLTAVHEPASATDLQRDEAQLV